MTFRGWELRIPLRVLSPSGQLLISSALPLTERCYVTSFGLCLSDATTDYLKNPILVVHSNATLASVRKLIGRVIPMCLYAISNTTTELSFGNEVLSLDPIKPPGISGLHELTKRNRQAPISDPKAETPLGHKLDREAIGELGFQTGRTLVVRLQPKSVAQGSTGMSSLSISDGMQGGQPSRKISGSSGKYSASGKLHPPAQNISSISASSLLPKVVSFLHSEKQNTASMTAVNTAESTFIQSPFTLPSLMLSAGGSVYESLFSLAETDLAEMGPGLTGINLLHMTRLLLYCLPTYQQPMGMHPSQKTGRGNFKSVSSAFAVSMICTPENLVKASQFRLLYLLQVSFGVIISLNYRRSLT